MPKFKQGIYEVVNKSKYIGTKNPYYRSSWEEEAFKYLDKVDAVIKWGSEIVVVMYDHPFKTPVDGRQRRYLTDLYVEFVDAKGDVKKELMEIKPHKETIPPVHKKGKKKKTILYEEATYSVNHAKWAAAAVYAKKHGMVFRLITENDIFR